MMKVAYFVLLAGICLNVKPIRAQFRLQILHNNDLHARFLETDAYSASCPKEFVAANKCFGGFARTKQAVNEAMQEAKKQNIPSIFLNAGDSFQGTPYYTIFKWQIVAKLIDTLGIDVMALGNHEFDDGIDNLVNYLKTIKTPVVCANLNITSEKRLDLPILTSSKILTVEGRKIGIIGYLTPETKEISSPEDLEIYPEIPYIRAEAQRLKADGVKIIIALGHSGFEMDVKIATEVEEVSVVVGGHSHSLLYTPKDNPPSTEMVTSEYPTIVTQKSGKIVPIVQAYAYSKYLGKLLVEFDEEGKVLTATGNTQLLDYTVKKEPELDKEISRWESIVKERISVVKGYTRTFLEKANFNEGKLESNLANLITDAFVDTAVHYSNDRKERTWTKSAIALYQSGGIRAMVDNKKKGGELTLEDLMTVLPFENKLAEISLRGSTIKKAIELAVSCYDSQTGTFTECRFLHFSGLRVVYDFTKPFEKRIKSIETLCIDCAVPKYKPLVDEQIYHVITTTFLAKGGDHFDMINDELLNVTILDTNDIDTVAYYIEKNRIVYPIEDNRVSVVGLKSNSPTSSASMVSSSILFYLAAFLPLIRICYFFE